MKRVVNGEAQDVPASTLAEALLSLDLGAARVATALNGEFVPAREREATSLKDGDRIVRCGSKEVGTIYDYMESMTHFKPGDQLDVVIVREGKEIKLQVNLAARPPE